MMMWHWLVVLFAGRIDVLVLDEKGWGQIAKTKDYQVVNVLNLYHDVAL